MQPGVPEYSSGELDKPCGGSSELPWRTRSGLPQRAGLLSTSEVPVISCQQFPVHDGSDFHVPILTTEPECATATATAAT